MKKAAFHTLGCKVNQYETEAMANLFEKAGYRIVDFDEEADVYVINTCTVTGISARKSRQMIRKARNTNRESVVVVVGCYAQTAPEEIDRIPGVNLVLGTRDRNRIVDIVETVRPDGDCVNLVDGIMAERSFEDLKVSDYKDHTRALLKIQDGCSQFCTYCIIPYARGPVRSRAPNDILKEVEELAVRGFKEIVLTGIHLASYGKDLKNTSLLDIIREINKYRDIERIRLGSIEPGTVTEEFVAAVAGIDRICPHYHVSLQSGCDETLGRMNRKYSVKDYMKVVELLRCNISDVALTTDVMVGFPGETDDEFEKTLGFLNEIPFARMHVFKYSLRKGTPAASYDDQISPEVKDERSRILIELSRKKAYEFNSSFTGRTLPVLFECESGSNDGMMEGLTPNYIKVRCRGGIDIKGEILDTTLLEAGDEYVTGRVVN